MDVHTCDHPACSCQLTGEGLLHYQLDNRPVIATTTPKLSFHGLSSGPDTLVVMLAANHEPLGPKEALTFDIP